MIIVQPKIKYLKKVFINFSLYVRLKPPRKKLENNAALIQIWKKNECHPRVKVLLAIILLICGNPNYHFLFGVRSLRPHMLNLAPIKLVKTRLMMRTKFYCRGVVPEFGSLETHCRCIYPEVTCMSQFEGGVAAFWRQPSVTVIVI